MKERITSGTVHATTIQSSENENGEVIANVDTPSNGQSYEKKLAADETKGFIQIPWTVVGNKGNSH